MTSKRHIRATVIVLLLFLGFSSFVQGGDQPSDPSSLDSGLCPFADHVYQLNLNKKPLFAPESEAQSRDLLRKAASDNKEEANRAIIALALAGNLEAFNKILSVSNIESLRLYCSYYQNPNGRKCIDPAQEAAVLENLDDPRLSEALLQFFRKSYYQNKTLFDKLVEMNLAAENIRRFEILVNALVATNIPGIEDRVLEHGLTHAAHIDRKLWWMVSSVDKHYVDFFVRRDFEPGIQYIKEVLDADHYSRAPESYKVHLINRHNGLYYKLDVFPSSQTGDIFINQLAKLVDVPWDMLFNVELEAVGRRSIKHSQSVSQRKQIVDHLAGIIETGNRLGYDVCEEKAHSKDSYTIRVRGRLVQFLAQSATDEAVAVLLQEFQGLVARKDCRNAANLASQVVIALNTLPDVVFLNVPEFLNAVRRFDGRERYLTVPVILQKHPHPEGHKHLLSLLDEIVAEKDGVRLIFGMDFESSFNWMLEILLAFDKPEYLFETRRSVDRFYEEERLEETLYVSASKRLNALIGNESPLYAALRKQKEEEERERKRQRAVQAREAYRAPYEEQIAQNLSPEGIKKNIEQLLSGGSAAKRAAGWLVLAGLDAIPHMHATLLDRSSTAKSKFKIISLLGVIGDESSVQPILETMRTEPGFVHKDVFLSLSHMPVTDKAFSFIEKQLGDNNSNKVKQSALIYFAQKKESRARKWIDNYCGAEDPDLRLAALYLGARLHDQRAKGAIVGLLMDNPDRSNQELLLRSLAELAPPAEFHETVKKSEIDQTSEQYYHALWLSEYRNALDPEKAAAAQKLLQSDNLWDRREAARYLIENARFDILEPFLLIDARVELPYMIEVQGSHVGQLIVLEARRMGWMIEDTDEGVQFSKE